MVLRCELYDMGELHVVDDVVLLGTPVTTEPSKWQKALWVKWKVLDGPGAPGGCKGVFTCCKCRKNMLLTGVGAGVYLLAAEWLSAQ